VCDFQQLNSMAAQGLVAMFDSDKQMFCHRLLASRQGLLREGISQRYTIMTLLGLRELEAEGVGSPFNIHEIYQSFVRDTKWIQGIGDLGLLIWLVAIFDPDRLGEILESFEYETAIDRFPDAREGRTMELSWFLSGVAHAAQASPKLVSNLTDPSVDTYHRIAENQGDYGLFGHMSEKKSLRGVLRGRIGSFADQVYPIYGLSKFAKAFDVEDPLGPALECATAISGAQGKSGQWWWLYDARSGRVSSQYPVYSVHQHGMAPMCLFAVEEATGQSFRDSIYRGLRWIFGENELGVEMRDCARNLIWRCILPENRQAKFWEMALNFIRSANHDKEPRALEVLYEQRPYEFGWLLFAFAKHSHRGSQARHVE